MKYVLKGRIIDGNGGKPFEKGAVLVENGRIVRVCAQEQLGGDAVGAQIIDAGDGSILPGLIDQHCHLTSGWDIGAPNSPHYETAHVLVGLRRMLQQGFTSLRDCGGIGNYLKEAWDEGLIESPRIFSAGKCISQTAGHGDPSKGHYRLTPYRSPYDPAGIGCTADGSDEVRRLVRFNLSQNADFIKICTSSGVHGNANSLYRVEYSDDEVKAAVEAAKNYGTYVASHCVSNGGIKLAVRCGVRTIEHASYLDPDGAKMMADNGCYLVSTYAVAWAALENLEVYPPVMRQKFVESDRIHRETFAYALKEKVKIGYGTDFTAGGDHSREFECLTELGMSPMETIVAATKTGAEILCRDDLGTIEQGKLADIIMVSGDPSRDIRILRNPGNIHVVMLGGKLYKNEF